ncbi:hypothetical protein [Perlabentimonas gracilis]|uniref:hypothetical protein n=1 Tax=Perlabentimonas gracilis TaxID=2715279 RepID=UPI001C6292B7|nr:hypothetical protein [Perlabentimonas gracilis]
MIKLQKILLLTFVVLAAGEVNAQSTIELLGRHETNFDFYSGSTNLEVSKQLIVKNAGRFYDYSYNADRGYGYGGGYETLRLEFETEKEIENTSKLIGQGHLTIDFVDVNGVILATIKFPKDRVALAFNADLSPSRKFYSVDLLDVPVLLLENTVRLNINSVNMK